MALIIWLYQGQANPKSVRLLDPTKLLSIGTLSKSDADSGSLTDGVLGLALSGPNEASSLTDGVLSIALDGISETAAATDTATNVLLITPADTATATDVPTNILLATPADTATATDAAIYAATLSDADAATLTDALSQIAVSPITEETMTMSEAASFTATVADTEQATGSDLATLITLMGLNESALISEFAEVLETNMINVMDSDTATMTEAVYLTILAADVRGGFASAPRAITDQRRHRTIITHFPASPSIFDVEPKAVQVMQLDGPDDDDKATTLMLGMAA